MLSPNCVCEACHLPLLISAEHISARIIGRECGRYGRGIDRLVGVGNVENRVVGFRAACIIGSERLNENAMAA
jgi:hypothetical protein